MILCFVELIGLSMATRGTSGILLLYKVFRIILTSHRTMAPTLGPNLPTYQVLSNGLPLLCHLQRLPISSSTVLHHPSICKMGKL